MGFNVTETFTSSSSPLKGGENENDLLPIKQPMLF